MSKKKGIICLILLFAIIVGVLFFLNMNKNSENNKQNDISWVEAFVPTIADALNGELGDLYIPENAQDLKIEIVKSDNYEEPFLILEYMENFEGTIYQNYEILYLEDTEVKHYCASYSGDNSLVYLYNIENNNYGWYVYSIYDDLIIVEAIDKIITEENWSEPYGSEAQFSEVYTKIDDINSYSSITVNFNIDENELKSDLEELAVSFIDNNENTQKLKERK